MPQISDIKASVQIASLIKDPIIREGILMLSKNGSPIMYSGGFTAVFPVVAHNTKWAFRCWHTELGNMRRRMEIISKEIAGNKLPYFCNLIYEDEGIIVNGSIYPTTRMEWVEGENLKDYICSHSNSKELKRLADRFLRMCIDLHKHGYAHGDLQHGNIIVKTDGELVLIDYDSMYVPSMRQEFADIITGLKDYQHPKRRENRISSQKIDYFSELIIYLSILAVSEDLTLIREYNLANTDRLLFSAADFEDIKQSDIYSKLYEMGGNFPLYLQILEEYLQKDSIDLLEPFDVLLDRYSVIPTIRVFKSEEGGILYKGDKIKLHWDVADYTALYLNGTLVDIKDSTYVEKLDKSEKYCLEAVNGLHHVRQEIEISVVEKPVISLKLTTNKLKKGKTGEQAVLKWDIHNADSIYLFINGKEETVLKSKGQQIVTPVDSTFYLFKVTGLDRKRIFERKISLDVLPEAQIAFSADKQFSFPKIPILLTWQVEYAKSVELVRYGKVEANGSKVVEIEKDTSFELRVTDDFGIQTKKVDVRMLPLPVVKAIMVPTPQICKKIVVKNNMPSMQAAIPMMQNLTAPIDASRLALPTFEGLNIEMKEMPAHVSLPKFHLLQLDIGNRHWWSNLKLKIKELNHFLKLK